MVAWRWSTLLVIWLRQWAQGSLLDSWFVWWQLAVGAQLWCRVLWWILFTGSWQLVEPACGETQEVQFGVSCGNLSDLEFAGTCWCAKLLESIVERIPEILTSIDVDDDGASCDATSARVVHAESSSGHRIRTCWCSASNQKSRDNSSVDGHSESHRCERPRSSEGVPGREGDFQQWSKKTEAFFAGVIKQSERLGTDSSKLGWKWSISSKTFSSKTTFIKNHFHQKTTFIKNHFHQNHFHQNHFDQNPLSSKTIFIKNHFHQEPLSSRTTFIKNHFHQEPLSSRTTFIKNHFHQKPFSSKTTFFKNHFHQKTTFIKKPQTPKT